jgi:hypothetical protein
MPAGRSRYLQSRQARNNLPFDFFSSVQNWTVIASVVVIVAFAFTPGIWRRRPTRLIGLAVAIVPAVIANALVTGAMSVVEDRYQARVVWLAPFLAGVLLLEWGARWQRGRTARKNET